MPGAGHMLINFQFLKGFFIVVGYFIIGLPLYLMTILLGVGFIIMPIIHLIAAFWAYSDSKRKFNSE